MVALISVAFVYAALTRAQDKTIEGFMPPPIFYNMRVLFPAYGMPYPGGGGMIPGGGMSYPGGGGLPTGGYIPAMPTIPAAPVPSVLATPTKDSDVASANRQGDKKTPTAGTTPGGSGTTPSGSGSTPGGSKGTPGGSGGTPGGSGGTPGGSKGTPGGSGGTPGGSGGTPGGSAGAPGGSGGTPGGSAGTPGGACKACDDKITELVTKYQAFSSATLQECKSCQPSRSFESITSLSSADNGFVVAYYGSDKYRIPLEQYKPGSSIESINPTEMERMIKFLLTGTKPNSDKCNSCDARITQLVNGYQSFDTPSVPECTGCEPKRTFASITDRSSPDNGFVVATYADKKYRVPREQYKPGTGPESIKPEEKQKMMDFFLTGNVPQSSTATCDNCNARITQLVNTYQAFDTSSLSECTGCEPKRTFASITDGPDKGYVVATYDNRVYKVERLKYKPGTGPETIKPEEKQKMMTFLLTGSS